MAIKKRIIHLLQWRVQRGICSSKIFQISQVKKRLCVTLVQIGIHTQWQVAQLRVLFTDKRRSKKRNRPNSILAESETTDVSFLFVQEFIICPKNKTAKTINAVRNIFLFISSISTQK
jgi:hypothetical protein